MAVLQEMAQSLLRQGVQELEMQTGIVPDHAAPTCRNLGPMFEQAVWM